MSSEARSRRVGGTPRSEPMRGCGAPGSYHRTIGDFLGGAGGRKKIAPWAWRVGKIQMFWLFEPVEESGGQMVARKRGTNMCRLTRAASSVFLKTPLLPTLDPRFGLDQPTFHTPVDRSKIFQDCSTHEPTTSRFYGRSQPSSGPAQGALSIPSQENARLCLFYSRFTTLAPVIFFLPRQMCSSTSVTTRADSLAARTSFLRGTKRGYTSSRVSIATRRAFFCGTNTLGNSCGLGWGWRQ